jgi:hypothetical protein
VELAILPAELEWGSKPGGMQYQRSRSTSVDVDDGGEAPGQKK